MCIQGSINVRGSYNTVQGSQFGVSFERCNQANYPLEPGKCKTKQQIDEWLSRKFLFTFHNEELFIKSEVEGENVVKRQGRIVWNVITPQIRQDYYNYVKVTDLKLRDRVMTIGIDDMDKERIFSIEEGAVRPYDFKDDV